MHEKQVPENVFTSMNPVPPHSLELLVDKLHSLQASQRSLHWNNEIIKKDIETLMGPPSFRPVNDKPLDMTMVVLELLMLLNRSDIFNDMREITSIGLCALGSPRGISTANFLFQVALAYELKLLLDRQKDSAFGNKGPKIISTMAAAERWIDNVSVRASRKLDGGIEIHSLVHERQVEGLVRFAEYMGWPYLGEMRQYIENAYMNIHAGTEVCTQLWDWLHGTMLPGNNFVFIIMSSLVMATPSVKSIGELKYFSSGLVLENRSYWRSKFVLGRLFGGLKGVRAANGWVGPCPLPTDQRGESMSPGWWRVQARSVEFKLAERTDFQADEDEGTSFSSLHHIADGVSRADWIRTIGDRSKWVVPVGPVASSDVVEYTALRFERLDAANSEKNETPLQRAFLDLMINGNLTTFTIFSDPVFITSPRCVDSPHPVHERDLPKLSHIKRVSELAEYVHDEERVLIIDATGEGECELAARAWCCQNGRHAVVRRVSGGSCFSCAVLAASDHGIGVNCLIWV